MITDLLIDIGKQIFGGPVVRFGEDQFVDCRVLADTNRDGRIDDRDSCVPTGGFINALRPINLALPLIEAARSGRVAINTDTVPVESSSTLPGAGGVIFEDDFSNENSGWPVSEDADARVSYWNESYLIQVFETDFMVWGALEDDFGDVIVTVDFEVIKSIGDADFGILCGYHDIENFHGLEVTEDGYFSIWKYEDGEFVALVDWRVSSIIPKTGTGTLTAACIDGSLALAVNGTPLVEVEDTSLRGGGVGLVVGTWDTADAQVAFDNIIIKSPNTK